MKSGSARSPPWSSSPADDDQRASGLVLGDAGGVPDRAVDEIGVQSALLGLVVLARQLFEAVANIYQARDHILTAAGGGEHVRHDVRGQELVNVPGDQVAVRPLRPNIVWDHHGDDTHPGFSCLLEGKYREGVGTRRPAAFEQQFGIVEQPPGVPGRGEGEIAECVQVRYRHRLGHSE